MTPKMASFAMSFFQKNERKGESIMSDKPLRLPVFCTFFQSFGFGCELLDYQRCGYISTGRDKCRQKT